MLKTCNCVCVNPSPDCTACQSVFSPYDDYEKDYHIPWPYGNYIDYPVIINSLNKQIETLLNQNLELKQQLFDKDVEILRLKNQDQRSEAVKALEDIAKKYNIKIEIK